MPWIWNPLWGYVRVGTPGVKKTAGWCRKTKSGRAKQKKVGSSKIWIRNPLWGRIWAAAPRIKKPAGQGNKNRNNCARQKKVGFAMLWIWSPLWGRVWVNEHRLKRSACQEGENRNNCTGPKKVGFDPPVPEQKNRTVESSSCAVDLCAGALINKFEQVVPGVFKFKHAQAMPASRQNKPDTNNSGSALPDDLGKYRRVGTTSDGIPVYTFT